MASKIIHENFNKRVIKKITELGAVHHGSIGSSRYLIETKAGLLNISLHEPRSSSLFSIFCCFDDTKKATKILTETNGFIENLNKYSGKWNFHSISEVRCQTLFETKLKEIL